MQDIALKMFVQICLANDLQNMWCQNDGCPAHFTLLILYENTYIKSIQDVGRIQNIHG